MLLKQVPLPEDPLLLAPHRVHEAGGPGRRSFAVLQAARMKGLVIWVQPAHVTELPMPWSLPQRLANRLILLRAPNETELLWSVEESLRSTAPALVIAEPQKPLSLTAGRRLQLAAEAGRTTGLMLIREGGGSNATETRWHCAPAADAERRDSTLQDWTLNKNKKGTLASWRVCWDDKTHALRVVSTVGERSCAADAPL
jgi:protein ImuA